MAAISFTSVMHILVLFGIVSLLNLPPLLVYRNSLLIFSATLVCVSMIRMVLPILRRQWSSEIGIAWPSVSLRQTTKERLGPPLDAEFLFYLFLDVRTTDALVGDLEYRYSQIRPNFGKRRADWWFWTQTLKSIGPVVLAWSRNVIRKPLMGMLLWVGVRVLLKDTVWLDWLRTLR